MAKVLEINWASGDWVAYLVDGNVKYAHHPPYELLPWMLQEAQPFEFRWVGLESLWEYIPEEQHATWEDGHITRAKIDPLMWELFWQAGED